MDPFAPWGRDGAFCKIDFNGNAYHSILFFLYSLTVSYIFGTNEWNTVFLEISPHKKYSLWDFH